MNYRVHVENWLKGIYSEIDFWTVFIKTKGVETGITEDAWLRHIDPDMPFYFDDIVDGDELSFVDVGSGPFSRCGCVSEVCKLNMTFVDPLGNIYEELKSKYGVNNGNHITRGFVEFLDKQFESNSFDIVHMSNSLDHCFDPVFGIYQLLNICKIGGKVILRHSENEAEDEKYRGLHQWNLSLKNDEDTFLIWNKDEKIDVCKVFQDVADFDLSKDVLDKDKKWIYNQVILTKNKDVSIPKNDYLFDFVLATYDLYAQTQQDKLEYDKQGAKRRICNEIKGGLGRKFKH